MNLKLVLAFAFTAIFAASVIMPAMPAMAVVSVPTCTAPQVLDPNTLQCVNPPSPTCTPLQVLDTATNTCITPPVTTPPGDSDGGEHEHHHDHGQKHHHEDRDE